MDSKQKYKVLGLMSGTSLDGVDIAFCTFQYKNQQWQFKIEKAITVAYNASWLKKLSQAHQLSAQQLLQLHAEYGKYLGTLCKRFFYLYGIKKVDFIASHGHTIFHQPDKGFTFQLGCGYALHAAAGKPVVCDFRSMDVALGGEGAPLVPIGDQYLFSDYDVCLNLGGIANLSQQVKGQRIAFDICFANMGLNYLAEKRGKLFDRDGALAADGTMDENMLKKLSMIYKRIETKRPSLGREFFEQHIVPVLNDETILLNDRLHTFTESVALQIASAVNYSRKRISVFCTGGGAFNAYLVYRLVERFGDRADLIIPEADIIKYKEALVFAFLGVKRVRHEPNCLISVTKAERDSSGGVLIGF